MCDPRVCTTSKLPPHFLQSALLDVGIAQINQNINNTRGVFDDHTEN